MKICRFDVAGVESEPGESDVLLNFWISCLRSTRQKEKSKSHRSGPMTRRGRVLMRVGTRCDQKVFLTYPPKLSRLTCTMKEGSEDPDSGARGQREQPRLVGSKACTREYCHKQRRIASAKNDCLYHDILRRSTA